MTTTPRTRVTVVVVALTVIAAAVAAGLLLLPRDDEGRTGQDGPVSEASTVVDPSGFTVTVDGVQVVGAAGVAPVGTEVTARTTVPDLATFDDFATVAGTGVEVILGDHLQPAAPITLTFTRSSSATQDPDGTVLAVVASTPDGGVELADARRQGDTVVVTTSHLSWFTPVWVAVEDFSQALTEQVLTAMKVRSPRPNCFTDDEGSRDGWTFAPVRQQLVWPCATVVDGRVEVTLANNSPEVWTLTADQDASPGLPTTTDIAGAALSAVALQLVDRTSEAPLVPGSTVRFSLTDPQVPVTFTAEMDDAMTVTHAVTSALLAFVPAQKLEKVTRSQCLIDAVTSTLGASDGPTGEWVAAVLDCFGEVVGGLTGALVSAVVSVPGTLTTLLDGIVRNIAGSDTFTVTLTHGGTDLEAGDLSDYVGTWSGAIDQPGSAASYTVTLTVTPPDDEGRVGTVVYPELGGCSGHLDQASVQDGTLSVTENITVNTDRCVEVVDLTLTLDGPDTLLYATQGQYDATGTLTRSGGETAATPGSSVWPEDRDDGPPALYVWVGASLLEFPDWVACDDSQQWCLLGGTGSHTLVEMDGLTNVGAIPATSRSPSAALARLGVPPASVREILPDAP